jgi:Na+/phosphate symporter
LSPILILVGVVMFMTSEATRRRDWAAIIGLGLVLTALQTIAANAAPCAILRSWSIS